MTKGVVLGLIASMFIVCVSFADSAVERHIKSLFPNLTVNSVRESPIEGVYEIVSDKNILYFYPKGELLIFGEIWSKSGKNLTADRNEEFQKREEVRK